MRASQILSFQATAQTALRRPWKTFRDGSLYYGQLKSGSKRHPLTTKQGNKHYYKGTRSTGIGHLDSRGRYHIDWNKVRTYVVPVGLNTTDLKPLVSPNSPQFIQKVEGYDDKFKSPELALHNAIRFVENGSNYSAIDLENEGYIERIQHPKLKEADKKKYLTETD
ncbi:MRPL27 [Candida pseudojiufengensis]|uniref:MRPL27 n=1 Tax=Candida pseudojiufengensis TaxID=497109 RepID=UPI0022244B0D|nr:MRPL27 [Candida pseudojiufengensis]KAI5966244.1 MRPL27 [Candida pseudojiufengensis]